MDLLLAFILFVFAMLACLLTDITMVFALIAGYIGFAAVALRRGNQPGALLRLSAAGMKDSLIVVLVLFMIGILTASWRAGGTILFFVYYGIKIITPDLFLLIAFLLSMLLSYAIGTSFGVAGTLGVILMALARSGGVNELIAAGAVMSGVYFGDRCSPASSSMILTAAVTNTDPNRFVRRLLRSGWLPTVLCVAAYAFLSFRNPLNHVDTRILSAIEENTSLSFWLTVPALFMLILPLFRVNVKIAMTFSFLSAAACSIFLQGMPPLAFLRCCIMGYTASGSAIGTMLSGGGLLSMLEINVILLISCTYSNIFEGTGMLRSIQSKLELSMKRYGRFPVTAVSGLLFSAVFCNQTIAITMSASLFSQPYKAQKGTPEELALAIGNSTTLLSGLVPWCIAASVPLGFLGVGAGALPYAFLLYAVPLCYLFKKPEL